MSRERRTGPSLKWRRRLVLTAFLLGLGVSCTRAYRIQVIEGEAWATRALLQHQEQRDVPAPRGTIYDRNGVPLASIREVAQISIAPREIDNPELVRERLETVLRLAPSQIDRALDPADSWVVLPGRHEITVLDEIDGIRGVYHDRTWERWYPYGELASEILGRVTRSGEALGGIELQYDELLRGHSGRAVTRRDGAGRPIPGALHIVEAPLAGHEIQLTLDYELQEIAEYALESAIAETGASGGDLIMIEPKTGEILAAASRRSGRPTQWTALTEPAEPGSTIKPFILSALLAEGRVTLEDSVFAENGQWSTGGRTITDVSRLGWITVETALRQSSNVAFAKLSQYLSPEEEYRYLRDFGFGTPTDVAFPSESAGILRRPSAWSAYSQMSLAIGYELSVTSLQLALAYATIANGGELPAPRLLIESRTPDGRSVERYPPAMVRRVIPTDVARSVADLLARVVEDGTARQAGLGPFRVAGKTGTARVATGGGYDHSSHMASFAGFFPADDPKVAFVTHLDRPRGDYYGGLVAAPIVRRALAAALASRSSVLSAHATTAGPVRGRGGSPAPTEESHVHAAMDAGAEVIVLDSVRQGEPSEVVSSDAGEAGSIEVPDVSGLDLRAAVAALHDAGLRVRLERGGAVVGTRPAAGAAVPPDSAVTILTTTR